MSRTIGSPVVTSDSALPLDDILKNGVRSRPDVGALAALESGKLCVLLWHYHDDDVPGTSATVQLEFFGLPFAEGKATLQHYRIDEDRSNAFAAWKRMGSPPQPTAGQRTQLEAKGRLATSSSPGTVVVENASATVQIHLPRQAVSLLELTW